MPRRAVDSGAGISGGRRFTAGAVLLALTLPEMVLLAGVGRAQEVFPPKMPRLPNDPGPVRVVNPAPLGLKVRRVRDAVEVVIENTGSGPQLEQTTRGDSWQGRLYTSRPSILPNGVQQIGAPEAGLQSIRIEGGGTIYNLQVTPTPGFGVTRPLVSADGRDLVLSFPAPVQPSLQTVRPNGLVPGAVATPNVAPPLRQRASAPPVGDMAVGTLSQADPSYLDVKGPPISLTFNDVPAHLALQAMARRGWPNGSYSKRGYGFVYSSKNNTETTTAKSFFQSGSGVSLDETTTTKQSRTVKSPPVSADFRDTDFTTAFNMILAGSGLQGKLVGDTIFVGPDVLSSRVGSMTSKVYRLNQVSARSAGEYLASLGAVIRVPNTTTTTSSQGTSTNVGAGAAAGGSTSSASTTTGTTSTIIQAYGGGDGPLLGLTGTTDPRLGTITIVGMPKLVAYAEQYLRQLDLRQRQVALSIRILDVTLDNDKTIDNSFAFRWGNNFIVNRQGELVANFGALRPPGTPEAGLPGLYDPIQGSSPIVGAGRFKLPGLSSDGNSFSNQLFAPNQATPFSSSDPNQPLRPGFGSYANPGLPGVTRVTPGTPPSTTQSVVDGVLVTTTTPGTPTSFEYELPSAFQYPRNQFFDFVRASIESRTTKVLASPTLILSENAEELPQDTQSGTTPTENFLGQSSTNDIVPKIGRKRANESAVVVGEQLITNYSVQAGQNGAPNTCQPEFGIAGLTFGARVSKIDDNGFVTFSLSPSISAATRRQFVEGCGFVDILALRSLDTGNARVRDGQTLILTGVISDRDLEEVTKWPILGDLPLVGQFFRNSRGGRGKRELVVMVTPRIINDTEGGTYGYGFEPSTRDTRQFMNVSPSSAAPTPFPQR
ncbi:MAG: general secretion pathway protein GspD [Cyanobacteria bacterium K_Offshore_surface_m2_239]|nr:general secretion pathway protein GspD [Cyanobacteria bacterium K_Offshore_surface_m2_239]